MSSSEPKWMQSIPNDFVCNYFWAFSAVILITGLVTVAGFIYLLLTTSRMRGTFAFLTIQSIFTYGLVFFLYVSLYLTCSRSLLDKKQ
jgi:hypothetical protein